jgi:hypothetical protein
VSGSCRLDLSLQCAMYWLDGTVQAVPSQAQAIHLTVIHASSCACQPMCITFHSICFVLVSRLQFVSNVVLPQQDAPVGQVACA